MSTEVTEANVFVRRLDGVNGSERISSTAGFDPRWRADGRELYLLDPAGWLIAAQFPDDGLRPSAVKPLFKVHVTAPTSPYLSYYNAAADGQKFLFRVPLEVPQSLPMTVTLDWLSAAVASLMPPPRPIQKVRRARFYLSPAAPDCRNSTTIRLSPEEFTFSAGARLRVPFGTPFA